MARTDVAGVSESVQNAGASLTQNTKDLAVTTLDAVQKHASAAGETIGAAVSSALDTAVERGKKAQKKARKSAEKSAKKARKNAGKKAQELSIKAQEKAGRHPRRKRRLVVFGGLALACVAIATALGRRKNAELAIEPIAPTPPREAPATDTGTAAE